MFILLLKELRSVYRLADVHVYFLRDDSTESVAGSNGAKYYVPQSTARSVFTSDPGGQPNSALSGQCLSVFLLSEKSSK